MINICHVELDGLGNIQVKMFLGDKLVWTSEEKSEIRGTAVGAICLQMLIGVFGIDEIPQEARLVKEEQSQQSPEKHPYLMVQ